LVEALKKQREKKEKEPKPEEKKKEEEKKPEEKKKEEKKPEEKKKEEKKAPEKTEAKAKEEVKKTTEKAPEPQAKPPEPKTKPAEPQAKPPEPKVKPAEPQAKPAEPPTAKPALEAKPPVTAKPVEPAPAAPQAPTPTVTVPKPSIPSGVSTAAKVTGATIVGGLLMPAITYANAIDEASKTVGVDRALMYAIAKQESNFNPEAKAGTSSAKGLYQFISGTWNDMVKKYGKDYPILKEKGPEDANASAIAGALFIKENSAILSKAKIPVDATSVYAAHFLGAGGARTLFTADPNKKAADIMPAAASANEFIFYEKTDKKIDKNKPRTVKQVINVLFEKVGQYQEKYAQALQQKDLGTQLALGSIQNQDLKKQGAPGTTVIMDNSQTNISQSAPSKQKTLAQGSSPDLPAHQQG
jgi:soluble lytic murein transglycosylase-like protein